MPQLSFTLDTYYELQNSSDDLKFDIVFGPEGQSPDFNVKLNGKVIKQHCKTSLFNEVIHNDEGLNDSILKIIGNICDVSKDSNELNLTLTVKGGITNYTKKFKVTVDEEGEEVDFALTLRFFI